LIAGKKQMFIDKLASFHAGIFKGIVHTPHTHTHTDTHKCNH